jgi:argininosuccinate synthase
MKSRGVYETPGGTILLQAHRGIESITLDRGAGHLKDELMPRYAELIYNGFWFAPEREMLQALIDKSQEQRHRHSLYSAAHGARVKLYKGNVIAVWGRAGVAGNSLSGPSENRKLVTFEDDAGAYDQKDAGGFIKPQRAAPARRWWCAPPTPRWRPGSLPKSPGYMPSSASRSTPRTSYLRLPARPWSLASGSLP